MKRQPSLSRSGSIWLEEFRKGQKSQGLDSKSRGAWHHGGSPPPFGTNRINHLQESNFSKTYQNGATLPVTLPVAAENPSL
jgi:hypothetical protein